MKFNKRNTVLLFIVLFSCSWVICTAQDGIDLLVKQIKSQCDKTNTDSKLFKVTEEDINGLSSEGGILKKFYEDKVLKKAEITLFGETGQVTTEYYFINGELIFAKSAEERYKEPVYMGKTETDSLDKNEFYFKNQILVRWIDNNGKIAEQTLYLQKQIKLLNDLKLINESPKGEKQIPK